MFTGAIDFDFGSPRALMETTRRLLAKGGEARPLRVKDDLNDVVARFYKKSWPSAVRKRRDYRLLPWCLAHGAPALCVSGEMSRLLHELGENPKPSQILGLLESFLQLTAEQLEKNGELIRRWLVARISQFEGRNPRIVGWKPYLSLLSNPRDSNVAKEWLTASNLEDWIKNKPFPMTSHLTHGLAEECCRLVGLDSYARCDDLLHLLEHVVKMPLGSLTHGFNSLLTALADHHAYEPKSSVINFALMQFGDPHLDSRKRWEFFDPRARALITQWISAEDLRLFFDELTGDRAGQERLAFWRAYLDEGYVTYSKLILCDDDTRRASTQLKKHLATGRHGLVRDSKASAFVVKIGNFFFLEFSGVNNACYIYRADAFPQAFFAAKHFHTFELKNKVSSYRRMSHNHDWQTRFDEAIVEMTGLRVNRDSKRRAKRIAMPTPTEILPRRWAPNVPSEASSKQVTPPPRSWSIAPAATVPKSNELSPPPSSPKPSSPSYGVNQELALAKEVAALIRFLSGGRKQHPAWRAGSDIFHHLFGKAFIFSVVEAERQVDYLGLLEKRGPVIREFVCSVIASYSPSDGERAARRLGLDMILYLSSVRSQGGPHARLGLSHFASFQEAETAYRRLLGVYVYPEGVPPALQEKVRAFVEARKSSLRSAWLGIRGR